jgi:Flp pilus assembly pilin Flp
VLTDDRSGGSRAPSRPEVPPLTRNTPIETALNLRFARLRAEEGQALVEYAIILSLVFVVVAVVLGVLGTDLSDIYGVVEGAVDDAIGP